MQVYLDTGTFDQLASQPGTYTAAIAVTATGFPSLTVPVTLTVGAAISIIASPVSLTFSVPSGPTVQAIQLSGSGGAAVSFSVTSSVSGTGNWLTASANVSYTPATLTVTVDPLNLTAGTYNGNVTVTPSSGAVVAIPVTLQLEHADRQSLFSHIPLHGGWNHASGAGGPTDQPDFERHLCRPGCQYRQLAPG
jgi:hypothetical protein